MRRLWLCGIGSLLAGILLSVVFWYGVPLVRWGVATVRGYLARLESRPGVAVSAEELRRIERAIAAYQNTKGKRPSRLQELVDFELLDPEDLVDEPHGDTSEQHQAVLYFPAVRPDDPDDLILLCTLFSDQDAEVYHVIFNDGKYVALSGQQLIIRLNRTYEFLGDCIAKNEERCKRGTTASSKL